MQTACRVCGQEIALSRRDASRPVAPVAAELATSYEYILVCQNGHVREPTEDDPFCVCSALNDAGLTWDRAIEVDRVCATLSAPRAKAKQCATAWQEAAQAMLDRGIAEEDRDAALLALKAAELSLAYRRKTLQIAANDDVAWKAVQRYIGETSELANAAARVAGVQEPYPTSTRQEHGPSAPAQAKKSGCFIATACYGSCDHPHVRVLRCFRDVHLLATRRGKLLVGTYYALAPTVATLLERRPLLARVVRRYLLEPIVRRITTN